MTKTIKITVRPSKLQADINTKGDKAQLNIGGNVVYQPLDCSTTINEDISATITSNGEYHYGYNPLTSTGLGSVDLSVNIPPQYVPVPGDRGTQGYQGTQGFAGTPGEQGVQGFPGTPGEQGIDGQPGPDGQQGAQGYQGTQGERGSQGEPGTRGEDGIQGAIGTQGYQGTQGLEGPQGPAGEQGPQGEPGPVDLENYYTKDEIDSSLNVIDTSINTLEDQFQQILDGEGEIIVHGTQGEQGTQGYQGTQGEQGVQGFPGTPGVNGVDGQPGQTGEQGTQGERGTQGYEGAQGLPGAPGVDGQPGPDGQQGTQGERGTQGYEGAQGYPGAQGYEGTQGMEGARGTQGYQGTQGEQGAQGFPGQPGPDGSSGPATILKALDEFPQDASAGDVVAIRTLVGPVWGSWTEDPENYFTFTIDTENEELQDAEETTILSFTRNNKLYRYSLYYDASGNLCNKIYIDDEIVVDSSGGVAYVSDAGPGEVHITTSSSGISVWAEDASDNYIPYDYTLGGEGTMNFDTYQYDGSTWNIIGGNEPDLTNYYTKEEIDASMNAIDSSIQQLANDSSIFVKSYECTWIKVMTEAQYAQITPDASVFYVLL